MNITMKLPIALMIAALPVTGFAQSNTTTDRNNNRQNTSQTDRQNLNQNNRQDINRNSRRNMNSQPVRLSEQIGKDVYDNQGQKIGEIEDVVIDGGQNEISYAVLSFGGFMGMGDKYFAIPWSSIEHRAGQTDRVFFNIDRQRLENAPGFDKNNWPDTANQDYRNKVDSYYGVDRQQHNQDRTRTRAGMNDDTTRSQDADASNRPGSSYRSDRRNTDMDDTNQNNLNRNRDNDNRNMNDNTNRYQDSNRYQDRNDNRSQQTTPANRPGSSLWPDRRTDIDRNDGRSDLDRRDNNNTTTNNNRYRSNDNQSGNQELYRSQRTGRQGHMNDDHAARSDGLLWSRKASAVIGADVRNMSNENIGEIEDIIVDPATGKVKYTIIDFDDSLVTDGRLVAVPADRLHTQRSDEAFTLNVNKQDLKNVKGFDEDHWPANWNDATLKRDADRAFKSHPMNSQLHNRDYNKDSGSMDRSRNQNRTGSDNRANTRGSDNQRDANNRTDTNRQDTNNRSNTDRNTNNDRNSNRNVDQSNDNDNGM